MSSSRESYYTHIPANPQEHAGHGKVKRKPPPSFPYSAKYPPPDPTNPFTPLSDLRKRAQSSDVALATPPNEQYTTSPAIQLDSGDGRTRYLLTPDLHPSQSPAYAFHNRMQSTRSPETPASKVISRPWHFLTSGYLSDTNKPSRPPRSKGRPGRDSTAYFSDADGTPEAQQEHQRVVSRYQQQSTHAVIASPARTSEAQNTVRARNPRGGSTQNRDSEYHYRRRSQSVLVLSPTTNANTLANAHTAATTAAARDDVQTNTHSQVQPSRSQGTVSPPRADPSRQYTYDDRQSHGMYDDYLNLLDDFRGRQKQHGPSTQTKSSRTTTESPASHRSGHGTPPMTPDDTLSSMSSSPPADRSIRGRRSGSISPPLDDQDSTVRDISAVSSGTIVQKTNAASNAPAKTTSRKEPERRPPQVVDTPASIPISDFPLLLPPSAPKHAPTSRAQTHPPPTPPMSSSHPQSQSHASQHAHASITRHAESEPETMPSEVGRRTHATTLGSMKRRLRQTSNTGIRGLKISNPSPVMSPGRKPSFASESSVSVVHGSDGKTTTVSTSLQVDGPSAGLLAPKKSLSYVNLRLKPLPNVSMGAPISPADMTTTGALGLGVMNASDAREDENRARAEDLLLHNAPKPPKSRTATEPPAIRKTAPSPDPVRYTPPPVQQTHISSALSRIAPAVVQEPEYESEQEDMGTYTAMMALRELLTPVSSQYPLMDPRASNYFASPVDTSFPPSARSSQRSPERSPERSPSPPVRRSPPRSATKVPSVTDKQPTSTTHRTTTSYRRSESPTQKVSTSSSRKAEPTNTNRAAVLPRTTDVSEKPSSRSDSPYEQTTLPRRRSESPIRRPSAPKPVEPPVHRPTYPPSRRSESPTHRPHVQRKESPKQRPSPMERRSESPVHHRVQAVAAAPPRAPSPAKQRSSPVQRRAESPVQHRQAPTQKRSESPVQRQVPPQRQVASQKTSTSTGQRQILAAQRRTESPIHIPPSRRRSPSPVQPMHAPATPPRTESPEPMIMLSPDPPLYEDTEPSYTMSPSSQALSPEMEYSNPLIRSVSPPPARAMSPIPSVQEQSILSSRARSPTPPSQKTRPSTERERPLPKRDHSRIEEQQSEEAEAYLPVAQLRSQHSSASKQTSSSQGTSRKNSAQVSSAQSHPRTRTRSPSPPPPPPPQSAVRARSPEPLGVISPRQLQALPREPESPESYSPPVRRQKTAPSTPPLASPVPTTRSHGLLPSEAHSHLGHNRTRHRRNTPPSAMPFSEDAMVTREQLTRASSLDVISQGGVRVPFGNLFKDRKTIVIFIRHFWCAMCQDFMYSISKNVDVTALRRAGVELVIIGNGSSGMIKSYRNIFRTPFELYTDPSMRLYSALGMTLRSNDPGLESEKGSYVRHGLVGGIAMVVRNALKVGMPIWEKGGEVMQLGGEFVFGPGMSCSYTHRMKNTRSHAPIVEVLAAADVPPYYSQPSNGTSRSMLPIQDEEDWMRERQRSLDRMRAKKEMRRGGRAPKGYVNEYDGDHQDDSEEEPDTHSLHEHDPWNDRDENANAWSPPPPKKRRPSRERHGEVLADREENRDHRQYKSQRKKQSGHAGFHASNPDPDYQYTPQYEVEKRDMWRADLAKMPSKYASSRDRDRDAYMLTHDALSYSYGQA